VTVDSTPQAARSFRPLKCPKCHSDDVKRSRRKFWERFVLPLLAAHVHRCRDCKHRFWVGTQWYRLVLASIALFFVGGIAVTMVLVKQARDQPATAPALRPRARRRRLPPPPPGLPPLSQVPRPKDDPSATGSGPSR
jgi:hypothetical protein